MKTTTRIFGMLAIMALAIFMDACKGTQGDVGPQGATGAIGATGATGAKGDKGDAGTSTTTGSSNVIQVTFTLTYVPPKPANDKIFNFPTAVTSALLNNSTGNVYVETSNFPGTWYAVPGAAISFSGGPSDVLRDWIDADARQIGIVRESGTNIGSITRTRVVLVPATTVLNGRKAAVDYSDYEAVKAYYNLKD
jgi:hypothetical protein